MAKAKIETYSTQDFRDKYMRTEKNPDSILRPGYNKFFISKVEDMLRVIKLPVPPSRATIHIFICITQGKAVMNIDSESYTINKDECFIVPAGKVYSFSNLDKNKGFICGFHPDFIVGKFGKIELLKHFEFLNIWSNPIIRLNKPTSQYVQHILKRLLTDYRYFGLKNTDILQAYFIAMLCEINTSYQSVAPSQKNQSVKLANRFRELLFKHIKSKHQVNEYASLMHITPNHLNKIVKQVTGKSPIKWIDETLVLEAKVLLYQTNYSISQIAEELGIYDQSYFSRLFKKYEKVTPLEFRKMIEMS